MFACVQAVPEDDDAVVNGPDVKSIVRKSSSVIWISVALLAGPAVGGASFAPSARHASRRISEHGRSTTRLSRSRA